MDSDDLYADLIADVLNFEETIRGRIGLVTASSFREISRDLLEGWLNIKGDVFDGFVTESLGWTIDGDTVTVPVNKDNEAKPTITRENVKFDRKYHHGYLTLEWFPGKVAETNRFPLRVF